MGAGGFDGFRQKQGHDVYLGSGPQRVIPYILLV
jgi:hypothetical protein